MTSDRTKGDPLADWYQSAKKRVPRVRLVFSNEEAQAAEGLLARHLESNVLGDDFTEDSFVIERVHHLSLLDTAIAYGEGKLDEASVAQLLGASSPVHVRAFVEALLVRDGGAALGAIDRAAEAGEDLGGLCREVVEVVRQLLVLKAAPSASLPDLTAAEAAALRSAAAPVSVDEVIYLLRAFLDADAEMRRSPHPRVELEIAAVRATRRPEPQMLDTLLAKVEDALAQFRAGAPAAAATTAAPAPRAAVIQDSLLASAPLTPAPSMRPVASAATPVSSPERGRPDRRSMREPPAPERVEPRREDPVPASTGDLEEGWQRVIAEVMKKIDAGTFEYFYPAKKRN
jgi:DNA polymerase-3 subunit gamma/tau